MAMQNTFRSAAPRRKRLQGGQEIIEFVLVCMVLGPALVASFVTGMSLLVTVQSKNVVRDLANLYIHGTDYSQYSSQQLAQRLAKGLNLNIGAAFSGSQQSNLQASGGGVIIVTELEYIGSNTAPSCVAVAPTACNHDSFVFVQRVVFGASSLYTAHPSMVGDYTASTGCGAIANNGGVPSPVTNTCAKLSSAAQSAMTNTWNSNSNQTALQDGQVIYMVEGYFDTSWVSFGSFTNNGVYSVYYF
jgi:hypothetical protein